MNKEEKLRLSKILHCLDQLKYLRERGKISTIHTAAQQKNKKIKKIARMHRIILEI